MFNKKSLSLVIPCFNEAPGLQAMLKDIPPCIDEVIVIDNNSTDNTAAVARQHNAKVVSEKNKGYGYACRTGLSNAKGDIIVLLDGDSSYPLSSLEALLSHLNKERCNIVVGCRYPLTNKNAQAWVNEAANYFISWLIRLLFQSNIRDSQSGMMILDRNVLNKIKLNETGMGFSQEIKIKSCLHPQIKYGEAAIAYLPRIGESKFRRQDAVKNLYAVFSLFRKRKALRN